MPKPTRAGGRQLSAIAAIVACLLLAGLFSLTTTASEAQEFPLDPYPGFGRSPNAALRDETTAYWEAFRREQLISSCMSSAGFVYSPAVAFPVDGTLKIAEGLAIKPPELPTLKEQRPAERNRSYRAELSSDQLERYMQSLVAESAADVEEADRTQMAPTGRGEDFATGGCLGKAEESVPSVWTLRRKLSDAYDTMRRSIPKSPEFAQTRVEFADCAKQVGGVTASHPADLERIVATGKAGEDSATAALRRCMPIWSEGYRRAEIPATKRFIEENTAALKAAKQRYEGVTARITQDEEFLSYLGGEVASARATGTTGTPER